MGPLRGVSIIEIASLPPGPFSGMMLADLGADVVRVDRTDSVAGVSPDEMEFLRGIERLLQKRLHQVVMPGYDGPPPAAMVETDSRPPRPPGRGQSAGRGNSQRRPPGGAPSGKPKAGSGHPGGGNPSSRPAARPAGPRAGSGAPALLARRKTP